MDAQYETTFSHDSLLTWSYIMPTNTTMVIWHKRTLPCQISSTFVLISTRVWWASSIHGNLPHRNVLHLTISTIYDNRHKEESHHIPKGGTHVFPPLGWPLRCTQCNLHLTRLSGWLYYWPCCNLLFFSYQKYWQKSTISWFSWDIHRIWSATSRFVPSICVKRVSMPLIRSGRV